MTLEDLIAFVSTDKTALLLFFLLLPVTTLILTSVSSGRGLEPPFNYLYMGILFAVYLPGVLSLTLWLYSMLFESKALWELPFFIYYLPIIVMGICIFIMNKRQITIRNLPWSGSIYELLILTMITFASILIIMKLEILNFKAPWQVGLFFVFWFGIFFFGWKRFKEITQ